MAFPKSKAPSDKTKKERIAPDPIGQALSEPGADMNRARHLWARHEALTSYGLPDDVVEAAGEAITARAVFDAKGTTCADDKGRTMLSVPKMEDAMRKLAACEGWQGQDATKRGLLNMLLEATHVYINLRRTTIGSLRHDGTWQQPPLPVTEDDGPEWLCDYKIEPVVEVAAGLFYAGRIGLIHGPSFGGKSTMIGNALARIVTGRPWLDKPTKQGKAIIMAEEIDTYAQVIQAAGGNLDRTIHPVYQWSNLVSDVEKYKSARYKASIVDSAQIQMNATARPLAWSRLFTTLANVMDVVSIGCGGYCRISRAYAVSKDPTFIADYHFHSLFPGAKTPRLSRRLFNLRDLTGNAFTKWMEKAGELKHARALFFSAKHHRMFTETRVILLTQAVEAYYRRVYKDKFKLIAHLKELCSEYKESISVVFPDWESRVHDAVRFRGQQTHYPLKMPTNSMTSEEQFALERFLCLILEICFMSQLDMSTAHITQLIERSDYYRQLRETYARSG